MAGDVLYVGQVFTVVGERYPQRRPAGHADGRPPAGFFAYFAGDIFPPAFPGQGRVCLDAARLPVFPIDPGPLTVSSDEAQSFKASPGGTSAFISREWLTPMVSSVIGTRFDLSAQMCMVPMNKAMARPKAIPANIPEIEPNITAKPTDRVAMYVFATKKSPMITPNNMPQKRNILRYNEVITRFSLMSELSFFYLLMF